MPGNEVEGFTRRSLAIALAGIYDLRIHHDEVLAPVLRAWNVWDRTDLGPEGEAARERLAAFMAGLDAAGDARSRSKRAEKAARARGRVGLSRRRTPRGSPARRRRCGTSLVRHRGSEDRDQGHVPVPVRYVEPDGPSRLCAFVHDYLP